MNPCSQTGRVEFVTMSRDFGTQAAERKLMGAVLIVDDSAADRTLLRTILNRAGYKVYEVSKGREAIQKAREVRPHLMILDVNLPDMNGFEVCRAIRGDREIASLPVLILTVRHDDSDVLAGLEAGADDYVAKDSDSTIVLGRVRRLIEFRQMSGMVMLNQQLVQIGRLVAGIMHEIRGPLSVIRGSAELLRMSDSLGEEDLQWVEAVLRNSHLLQLRLDHLMAAVRNRSSDVQVIDLAPLVRESAELFVKGLSPSDRKIEIEIECDASTPRVRVDAGRLMQVFFNLLSNAQQAVSSSNQGGRILVRTSTSQDEGGRWVLVEVVDDGPGVPEEYIDRLFDPFFTTKENGTGYGLYLAAEILKEQAGRLSVRNNRGGGAAFTIWLPGDAECSEPPSSSGDSSQTLGGTQQP
jgi:signal transduction histidine kinase